MVREEIADTVDLMVSFYIVDPTHERQARFNAANADTSRHPSISAEQKLEL